MSTFSKSLASLFGLLVFVVYVRKFVTNFFHRDLAAKKLPSSSLQLHEDTICYRRASFSDILRVSIGVQL